MDVDFWSSRVFRSSRHFSAVHASGLYYDNHIVFDDSEGDDDFKALFPCPFCYEEIDVNNLCRHLQNEHCFNLNNAVCPLCAANLGKDATRHFIEHHTSSLKRRRRSNRSGFLPFSSASLSRELSSFLGSSGHDHVKGNVSETTPDPLLTPFLHNLPFSNPNQAQQEDASSVDSPATSDAKSPSSSDEGEGQDHGTRRQRAAFVQELVASIIF